MGTMISCVEPGTIDIEHMGGIILAGVSAAVGGASIVCSSLLLGQGSGLGPINLLFYFSPIQAAMLGFALPAEFAGFVHFARAHEVTARLPDTRVAAGRSHTVTLPLRHRSDTIAAVP